MPSLESVISHIKNRTFGHTLRRVLRRHVRKNVPPVGDVYYGRRAFGYDELRTTQRHWKEEWDAVEVFLKDSPRYKSVLDIPFGTGRFAPLYSANGLQVFGLDSSQDMLDVARTSYPEILADAIVCVANATKVPFSDKAFDIAICARFLSSIVAYEDAKLVLKEIRRVTRHRALLWFRVDSNVSELHAPVARYSLGPRSSRFLEGMLETYGFSVYRTFLMDEGRHAAYACVIAE